MVIRIPRFWARARRTRAAEPVLIEAVAPFGLDAFGSEEPGENAAGRDLRLAPRQDLFSPAASALGESGGRFLAAVRWTAVMLLSTGVAAAGIWTYQRRTPAPPAASGHSAEPIRADAGARPGTLVAGFAPIRRAEPAPATLTSTGTLYVETDPPHLPVLVDDVERGVTPLTIGGLEPGDHKVTLGGTADALPRIVSVRPNERVTLIASRAEKPGTAAGWLAVSSAIALQLREHGRIIGTTDAARVMLPTGEHDLELVNESLGFLETRRVTITDGKTSFLAIDVPKGTLSVNAQPWADVWVDGRSLGQTPIGNISTPIGSHDVVFRHPQLGERRESIVVHSRQPAHLAVDMRQK